MPRAGALMYKREHSKVEQKSRGKYLTCARKTRPSQKLEGGDMLGARGAGAQGRRYMCTGELRRCNAGLQNRESKPRPQHGAGEESFDTRTHDNSERGAGHGARG